MYMRTLFVHIPLQDVQTYGINKYDVTKQESMLHVEGSTFMISLQDRI